MFIPPYYLIVSPSKNARDPSKTELVYIDLHNLYEYKNENRRNPRLFRLAFESYILKSQQLTEAMRSEYRQRTGLTWEASKFEGWNAFTNALKKIRNAAIHGYPIVLNEITLSIYPNIAFAIDSNPLEDGARKYRATKGKSFLSDSLSESFTSKRVGYLRKEIFSPDLTDIQNYVFPIIEFVCYELDSELLKSSHVENSTPIKIGDVVRLVLKSFPVLKDYMIFYKGELEKNLFDSL